MKSSRSSRLGLSGLVLVLPMGCASGTQVPAARIDSPGQGIFNGYEVAGVNCYKCHDGTARGAGHYPDLSKKVPQMTDEEILSTINEGPGHMPSFAEKLSEDQKQQIVAWLRSEFGGPGSAPE